MVLSPSKDIKTQLQAIIDEASEKISEDLEIDLDKGYIKVVRSKFDGVDFTADLRKAAHNCNVAPEEMARLLMLYTDGNDASTLHDDQHAPSEDKEEV